MFGKSSAHNLYFFSTAKELPEILENTCGLENVPNPTEDDGLAYVYPTPDQQSFEGSLALMSGPRFTDSNTNCRLKFWYYYYTDDENYNPLIPSIRHLRDELESDLDYLEPTGSSGYTGLWKEVDIGLGRQYYRFQVISFKFPKYLQIWTIL